jgi:hypothetical protein
MNARRLSVLAATLAVLAISIATIPTMPIHARTKLTSGAPQPAAPSDGYTITGDAPNWQAKTKAHVVGYVYGNDKVFDGVLVFNAGTSTLKEIQIGAFLEGIPDGVANPIDLGFVPFGTGPVEIAPNAIGLVTALPFTLADLEARVGDHELRDVVATLGVVNAKWADGKKFVAQEISNGFLTKPNAALDAKWTLVAEAIPINVEDMISIWDLPIIVYVPNDEDFYYCKTVTGWRCLMWANSNECAGSIKCTSCTSSTSKKCVKLHLPEFEPV